MHSRPQITTVKPLGRNPKTTLHIIFPMCGKAMRQVSDEEVSHQVKGERVEGRYVQVRESTRRGGFDGQSQINCKLLSWNTV